MCYYEINMISSFYYAVRYYFRIINSTLETLSKKYYFDKVLKSNNYLQTY